MKDLNYFSKIFVATKPVDFRKQVAGLAQLVEGFLQLNPMTDRYLFVFTNKRARAVKILYWDKTGFALWSKKLEKNKFHWKKSIVDKTYTLNNRELKWLLEGIDLNKIKPHDSVNFTKTS